MLETETKSRDSIIDDNADVGLKTRFNQSHFVWPQQAGISIASLQILIGSFGQILTLTSGHVSAPVANTSLTQAPGPV